MGGSWNKGGRVETFSKINKWAPYYSGLQRIPSVPACIAKIYLSSCVGEGVVVRELPRNSKGKSTSDSANHPKIHGIFMCINETEIQKIGRFRYFVQILGSFQFRSGVNVIIESP